MRQAVDEYNDALAPKPPQPISPALASSKFYETGSLPLPVLESFEDTPQTLSEFEAHHKIGVFKDLQSRLKTAIATYSGRPINSLHFKREQVRFTSDLWHRDHSNSYTDPIRKTTTHTLF